MGKGVRELKKNTIRHLKVKKITGSICCRYFKIQNLFSMIPQE